MDFKANILYLLFFCLSITYAFHLNIQKETVEIVDSCVKCHETDPKKINVHLIHHSHDDVGWLKTVDQYFWGLNYTIVNVGVQYIITSVVNALWDHPQRRFIQVETAFFWQWWKNQDDIMRNKFKTLVDRGQLEIINGGWVMNDEACVNYQSTIDQFTWGFRILNDTLGHCGQPTIGWQIDPFGHSREHASILSKIGFDGLFFARLDDPDREQRKKDRNMDFLWKTSANNDDSVIFGGMFGVDNIYYPPDGFCFDVLCGDDSINDDPESDTYNVIAKVNNFAKAVKQYSNYFKTNNVLVTMGGDFQYQAAEINFQNSEKLIRAFENNTEINLIYSTPSCYLRAVYEAKPNLVTKTDDFFPYGSANHSYWAGYFTSRQNFKRFERIGHNILQIAKQLTALAKAKNLHQSNINLITGLREGIGVAQHHDAITGTEKQHVAHDYTKILSKGISQAEGAFTNIIGGLVGVNISSTQLNSCLLVNISICNVSQSTNEFIVVAYNPLSWPVNHVIRLPVESESYSITGPSGKVAYDIVASISNFTYVKLDGLRPANLELVFVASNIPPLGLQTYYITKETRDTTNRVEETLDNTWTFGNEDIGFTIDNSTNLLQSVTMNGITLKISQQFMYYISHNGTNETDPSGAYIFRPKGEAISFKNPSIVYKKKGNAVDEIQQRVNDWISQIIRVYKGTHNYIEFDWLVGPLNISDNHGIEVITRFTVDDFHNNKTFYTDSNGREMIRRILNYRSTYTYNSSHEPIASNYYPVTSKINMVDTEKGLKVAILNERSQGGSSLAEGQLELMIHRRNLRDDNKGVGEPMNETEFGQGIVARGQHYLIIGPTSKTLADGKTITTQERLVAQQKLLQPWIGVGDASQLSKTVISNLVESKFSALKTNLPENINILTLEPWTNSSYILRLEHIMEKDEDPKLSKAATIDLEDLFADLSVKNIVETTLGANRRLKSLRKRYDWTYKQTDKVHYKSNLNGNQVVLSPMDIKTFIVELN